MATHAYYVWRDTREYERFKTLTDTSARQKVLRRWVMESVALYGLLPLIILVVLGHGRALFTMPAFLLPVSDGLRAFLKSEDGGFLESVVSGMAMAIVPGLLLGHTAVTLGRVYVEHGKKPFRNPMLDVRDVEHLFPRNQDERRWTAALSVSAGVNEELTFRLVIPLLFFLVLGSSTTALILAAVWFGLAHCYQGWFGVFATMFLGGLFLFIYLLTQSLWLAMLIHAIVDLNDLAFAPWFADWLDRRKA